MFVSIGLQNCCKRFSANIITAGKSVLSFKLMWYDEEWLTMLRWLLNHKRSSARSVSRWNRMQLLSLKYLHSVLYDYIHIWGFEGMWNISQLFWLRDIRPSRWDIYRMWQNIRIHSCTTCLKKSFALPPPINAAFLRLNSWFIDAANILWSLNHETRRGEQDGDLMTADRQGGTVSPISSLCGPLLSDKRSCTTPDLSHVLLIACQATQDNKDVFGRVCLFVWARDGKRSDICGWGHFVLILIWEIYVV